MNEQYISFPSQDAYLSAIIHVPDDPDLASDTGVLIVVGGPQYRIGSHRQFIKLSRALAAEGIASMRLDSSGTGDSSGTKATFYQQNEHIELAITVFLERCPQLKNVVLWGLCDAASAILLKLNQPDPRINGVIMLNPWVRQQNNHAAVMLKNYYPMRLFSSNFWHKIFTGQVSFSTSIPELWNTLKQRHCMQNSSFNSQSINEHNFVGAMLHGLQQFNGKVLIITSGKDFTAQEFFQLCANNKDWQQCLVNARHCHIPEANHTFSSKAWREYVEYHCVDFLLAHFKK